MSSSQASGSAPQSTLPLFYQKPEPLRSDIHAELALDIKPDFRFAANTNAVPIMGSEFVLASRFYPIVFVGETAMPVAVLGLEQKNLFVDGDGLWQDQRTYIPAYVRRYPFTFITQAGTEGFVLGLDMACDRIVTAKDDGPQQPLFVEGKPTALTEEALRFCGALQNDYVVTAAFAAALADKSLLIERQAQAVTGGGRRLDMHGFKIVDAERFQNLPDDVVIDWHKKGWLALVHNHLASLERFQNLLERASATG